MSVNAPLRLAGSLLLFAATSAVALAVVSKRLERPKTENTIAPSAQVEGIVHADGPGRLLFVDSAPEGARIWVDGHGVGATPWSSDWSCDEGAQVQLRVERSGFKPFLATASCRAGTTRVFATLDRSR